MNWEKNATEEIEFLLEAVNSLEKTDRTVEIIDSTDSFSLEFCINEAKKENYSGTIQLEKVIDELENYIRKLEHSEINNIIERKRVLIDSLDNDAPLEIYLKEHHEYNKQSY